MKEILRHIVDATDGSLRKTCLAREYLQARILQALQDSGAFREWAFVGGTALRFLYAIPRFSENLDFSLISLGANARFTEAMERVEAVFRKENYAVSIAAKAEKTGASAFIKFPGLPFDLGLSGQRSHVFSIKIELDTNPPSGAAVQVSLVRRHVTLNLTHYDKASLLAGKMHAVLTRKYAKGRDLYDLVWCLSDRSWPPPNLALLNAALTQTNWTGPTMTPDNWRSLLIMRMDQIVWKSIRADVQPFLERPEDADLITRDNLLSLLNQQP